MAFLMAAVAGFAGYCMSTIWGLQERRFETVFEAVSSAARYMTMGLVFCFLALQRRGELPFAFI